jgi:hypothetical protein
MAVLLSADYLTSALLVLGRSIRRPSPRGRPSRLHPRASSDRATRLCTNLVREPTVRVDTECVPADPPPSSIPKKSSRSTVRSPADSPFSTTSGGGSNATSFAAEQGPKSTDASSPGQVCLASHPSPVAPNRESRKTRASSSRVNTARASSAPPPRRIVSTSSPLTPCFATSQCVHPASLLARIFTYLLLRAKTCQRVPIASWGRRPSYSYESLARAAPAGTELRTFSLKDNHLLTPRARKAKGPSTPTRNARLQPGAEEKRKTSPPSARPKDTRLDKGLCGRRCYR